MAVSRNTIEKLAVYGVLIALLVLAMKNCSDGNKARETNETVKEVAANVDTVKRDVKKVKKIVKKTYRVVHKIEHKLDTIEAKIDECCDCDSKPVVPVIQPKDTVAKVPVKPKLDTIKPESKPMPVSDTVKVDQKTLDELKKLIHEALDTCCNRNQPVQIEQPVNRVVNGATISCTTRIVGYGSRSR